MPLRARAAPGVLGRLEIEPVGFGQEGDEFQAPLSIGGFVARGRARIRHRSDCVIGFAAFAEQIGAVEGNGPSYDGHGGALCPRPT